MDGTLLNKNEVQVIDSLKKLTSSVDVEIPIKPIKQSQITIVPEKEKRISIPVHPVLETQQTVKRDHVQINPSDKFTARKSAKEVVRTSSRRQKNERDDVNVPLLTPEKSKTAPVVVPVATKKQSASPKPEKQNVKSPLGVVFWLVSLSLIAFFLGSFGYLMSEYSDLSSKLNEALARSPTTVVNNYILQDNSTLSQYPYFSALEVNVTNLDAVTAKITHSLVSNLISVLSLGASEVFIDTRLDVNGVLDADYARINNLTAVALNATRITALLEMLAPSVRADIVTAALGNFTKIVADVIQARNVTAGFVDSTGNITSSQNVNSASVVTGSLIANSVNTNSVLLNGNLTSTNTINAQNGIFSGSVSSSTVNSNTVNAITSVTSQNVTASDSIFAVRGSFSESLDAATVTYDSLSGGPATLTIVSVVSLNSTQNVTTAASVVGLNGVFANGYFSGTLSAVNLEYSTLTGGSANIGNLTATSVTVSGNVTSSSSIVAVNGFFGNTLQGNNVYYTALSGGAASMGAVTASSLTSTGNVTAVLSVNAASGYFSEILKGGSVFYVALQGGDAAMGNVYVLSLNASGNVTSSDSIVAVNGYFANVLRGLIGQFVNITSNDVHTATFRATSVTATTATFDVLNAQTISFDSVSVPGNLTSGNAVNAVNGFFSGILQGNNVYYTTLSGGSATVSLLQSFGNITSSDSINAVNVFASSILQGNSVFYTTLSGGPITASGNVTTSSSINAVNVFASSILQGNSVLYTTLSGGAITASSLTSYGNVTASSSSVVASNGVFDNWYVRNTMNFPGGPGWMGFATSTWTLLQRNATVTVFSANIDVSSILSPGMRLRAFVQSNTLYYTIIAVGTFTSSATNVTCLNANLTSTATSSGFTVTDVFYSTDSSPYNFPLVQQDFIYLAHTAATGTLVANQILKPETVLYSTGNIRYSSSSGVFNLTAGKIYQVRFNSRVITSAGFLITGIKRGDTGVQINSCTGSLNVAATYTAGFSPSEFYCVFDTSVSGTSFFFFVLSVSGSPGIEAYDSTVGEKYRSSYVVSEILQQNIPSTVATVYAFAGDTFTSNNLVVSNTLNVNSMSANVGSLTSTGPVTITGPITADAFYANSTNVVIGSYNLIGNYSGWISLTGDVIWTLTFRNSTHTLLNANADVTGVISTGMRMRGLAQFRQTYWNVLSVGQYLSGSTSVVLYNTNFSDSTTSNFNVTNVFYSVDSNPFGFPSRTLDYFYAVHTAASPTLSNGLVLKPETVLYNIGNIRYSSVDGIFNLTLGKVYRVEMNARITSTGGWILVGIKRADTGVNLDCSYSFTVSMTYATGESAQPLFCIIDTYVVGTAFQFFIFTTSSSTTIQAANSNGNDKYKSSYIIFEIGTSVQSTVSTVYAFAGNSFTDNSMAVISLTASMGSMTMTGPVTITGPITADAFYANSTNMVIGSYNLIGNYSGWISLTGDVIWTLTFRNSTHTFLNANADVTGVISAGMRMRGLAQFRQTHWTVMSVGMFTGGVTSLVLYNANFTDVTTSNFNLTNVFYSVDSAPFGFPVLPKCQIVRTAGITISGVTSNPTKGTTSIDESEARVVGDWLEVNYLYRHTVGGAAGSGDYLISLPPGYTVDTSIIPAVTTTSANIQATDIQTSLIGYGHISDSSARGQCSCFLYSSTRFRVGCSVAYTTYSFLSSSFYGLSSANIGFSATIRVPLLNAANTTNCDQNPGSSTVASTVATVYAFAGNSFTANSMAVSSLTASMGSMTMTGPVVITGPITADAFYANSTNMIIGDYSLIGNFSGWLSFTYTSLNWTLTQRNSSHTTFSVDADITGVLSAGMRFKALVQSRTIYYNIMSVSQFLSGSTSVLCQNTNVTDTSTSSGFTVTNIFYSVDSAPFGFPLETIDCMFLSHTTGTGALAIGQVLKPDTVLYNSGDIVYSSASGIFNLTMGKIYRVEMNARVLFTAGGYLQVALRRGDTNAIANCQQSFFLAGSYTGNYAPTSFYCVIDTRVQGTSFYFFNRDSAQNAQIEAYNDANEKYRATYIITEIGSTITSTVSTVYAFAGDTFAANSMAISSLTASVGSMTMTGPVTITGPITADAFYANSTNMVIGDFNLIGNFSGWLLPTGDVVWTLTSRNATHTFVSANADVTGFLSPGMRFRALAQNRQTYWTVMSVSQYLAGATSVLLFNANVTGSTTSNFNLTNVFYSVDSAPYNFPLDVQDYIFASYKTTSQLTQTLGQNPNLSLKPDYFQSYGDITYSPTTGFFNLTMGKVYEVEVNYDIVIGTGNNYLGLKNAANNVILDCAHSSAHAPGSPDTNTDTALKCVIDTRTQASSFFIFMIGGSQGYTIASYDANNYKFYFYCVVKEVAAQFVSAVVSTVYAFAGDSFTANTLNANTVNVNTLAASSIQNLTIQNYVVEAANLLGPVNMGTNVSSTTNRPLGKLLVHGNSSFALLSNSNYREYPGIAFKDNATADATTGSIMSIGNDIKTTSGGITVGLPTITFLAQKADGTSPTELAYIDNAGNFQITGANAYKSAGTTWTVGSDERIKKNIAEIDPNESEVVMKQFKAFRYEFRESSRPRGVKVGSIAQHVEHYCPECVSDNDGLKMLDISDLLYHSMNVIKLLSERIEKLEQNCKIS